MKSFKRKSFSSYSFLLLQLQLRSSHNGGFSLPAVQAGRVRYCPISSNAICLHFERLCRRTTQPRFVRRGGLGRKVTASTRRKSRRRFSLAEHRFRRSLPCSACGGRGIIINHADSKTFQCPVCAER